MLQRTRSAGQAFKICAICGRILSLRFIQRFPGRRNPPERYTLDTPFTQVARFEIRKRPIKTRTWTDIPLEAEQDRNLQILANGSVVYGGGIWKPGQIKEKLKAWSQEDSLRPVILRAASDCPYTQVTKILEACAEAGLPNVSFAAGENMPPRSLQ